MIDLDREKRAEAIALKTWRVLVNTFNEKHISKFLSQYELFSEDKDARTFPGAKELGRRMLKVYYLNFDELQVHVN